MQRQLNVNSAKADGMGPRPFPLAAGLGLIKCWSPAGACGWLDTVVFTNGVQDHTVAVNDVCTLWVALDCPHRHSA